MKVFKSVFGPFYNGELRQKQVSGSTLVSAAFSIANIIGPQTFQAKEAPG